MWLEVKRLAIVIAVAATVLFTNLGGPRLWDRDEPRNAGCAEEMMARGDWVVPWFNDELRPHKPVLLYWLMISAYSVLGVNEFSARFWSAALGVGTSICVYLMGRRLFNPRVGMWGAIVVATTLMFDVAGRAATPDSLLIFCCAAALATFVLGTILRCDENGGLATVRSNSIKALTEIPFRTAVFVNCWLGLAMLAKGPVGVILPTAIIGMFMLLVRLPQAPDSQTLEQRGSKVWVQRFVACLRPFEPRHFLRTYWAMRPITSIAVCLALSLPWYIWVGYRTDGEFLRGFFLEHNFARATTAFEGHRGPTLFYYPFAILVGFFPWSVFFGPTLIDSVGRLRRSAGENLGLLFALCWAVVWIGAFSLAKTKLPSYVTPSYPALALLVATFLDRWMNVEAIPAQRWLRFAFGTFVLVGVVLLVAIPLVARRYLPGDEWLGVIGVIPLVSGVVAIWLAETKRRPQSVAAFATGALIFTTGLFAFAVERVDSHQQNYRLWQAIHERSGKAQVAAFGCLEPTWVFYGGWPIRDLSIPQSDRPAESAVRNPYQPKASIDAAEFLANGEERFVITFERHLPTLRPHLPPDVQIIAEAPRFLKNDRIVVLARASVANVSRNTAKSLPR